MPFQPIDPKRAGLKRKLLPQIPKNKMGKFVRLLLGQGVPVKAKHIRADEIKPLQKNVNKEKLREMQPMANEFADQPFIVSKDNYIFDGHHRWLLAKESNKDRKLRAIVIGLPINELVKAAHRFSDSHTRDIND